jgi:hypothetical protein
MKVCAKCKTEKPLEDFHNMKKSTDGKQKTCKACQKAYSQSTVCKENRKAYYQKTKREHINRNLKKHYGIDYDQYDEMLAAQNGKCAICPSTEPGGKGRFHVDHCHTTGKVRGLLCHHCNTMLGLAKDSIQTLEKAIHYLKNV